MSEPRHGLRLVLISDTHGHHDMLQVPPGDVLIHAGDFTRYGRHDDVIAFNQWLGTLPHAFKFVILGNHESNSAWVKGGAPYTQARCMLSFATLLVNESAEVPIAHEAHDNDVMPLRLFGTNFAWPMAEGEDHPNYSLIPKDTDVLITHGPPKGNVDGMLGCQSLARHVERVRPKVLVCGHIHEAHGVEMRAGTCYANAANAKRGHGQMGWEPIVLDI